MSTNLILIVEDDPTLRMLLQKMFEHLGYQCVAVSSGEEAVERACGNVAIVFMDIGLPGIDGTQAARLIRERELQKRRKRVPIIALTAHSDKEGCLLAGMDDFLQKPASLADLKYMVERWISCCQR